MRLILLGFWAICEEQVLVYPTTAVMLSLPAQGCDLCTLTYPTPSGPSQSQSANWQHCWSLAVPQFPSFHITEHSMVPPWRSEATSCMLINVQLTLIWKLTMYFSPLSQAEGQALLAARLVHIQNVPVEATGGLIHGFTDSLLWPCREPRVVQSPGVAVLEQSPNSGAFPRCLEHPTVGTNTTRLCQDPGWCCSSTGQGSPHSAHDFPNSTSSLPCPQGKSPWVRGDSSTFPVVLKENQFLHFWFLLFTCLINYTT